MRRLIAALSIAVCLTLTGCVGSLLDKVPNYEFETFEYHRTGNISSTHIVAENAREEDGRLSVDSITGTTDWGPAFSLQVKVTGYKRDVPTSAVEE